MRFFSLFRRGDCHSVSYPLGRDLRQYGGDDARWSTRLVSSQVGTISLQDWKICFRTWIREKRQLNTSFNDEYAFEVLVQHLEHKALQTYEQWRDSHWMELCQVEWYWETRVELVSALK